MRDGITGQEHATDDPPTDRAGSGHLKRIVLVVGPIVVMGIALACLVLRYLAGDRFRAYLFNSDAFYLPTLVTDLLDRGGSLSHWYLTPPPYFFPDAVLSTTAHAFDSTTYGNQIIYALLQIILLYGAVVVVCGCVQRARRWLVAATATTVIVWLTIASGSWATDFSYLNTLAGGYHVGGLIATMLLVGLWLRASQADDAGRRRLLLAGATAVAFLATLSDALFMVQTLVPFAIVVGVVALRDGREGLRQSSAATVPFAAGVVGYFAYYLVVAHDTRYPTRLGFEKLGENLRIVGAGFRDALGSSVVVLLVGLLFAALAVLIASPLRRRLGWRPPSDLVWLVAFTLVSAACTTMVVSLNTLLPVVGRYFLVALYLPIVLVILAIATVPSRYVVVALTAVQALTVVVLAGSTIGFVRDHHLSSEYYPPEVACLDRSLAEDGLTHGVAQYWDAKYVQSLSRRRISLAQYFADLKPMKWITSDDYYRDTYDFALISTVGPPEYDITDAALARSNPPPTRRVQCGRFTVAIYGRDRLRVP